MGNCRRDCAGESVQNCREDCMQDCMRDCRRECARECERECERGPRVFLYEFANFQGGCVEITEPIACFCKCGLGGTVGSIRVDRGTWKFFECEEFRGRCFCLSENGGPFCNGEYPSPAAWCGMDIRSLYPCE